MNHEWPATTTGHELVLAAPAASQVHLLGSGRLEGVYARDLRKWLVIAPVIGLTTGLVITAIVVIILGKLWPAVLGYYLRHHWAIVPGLVLGFIVTGFIMQFLTADPNEHSTEEIIRSYHEHEGRIDTRCFVPKLVAAIATVGFGGSAALEGPSIYGGGAIGSWLWTKLRRLDLDDRDRRIMLICGAAAGMSAVFRAPLTGIVFALEMPYRDDLAHEALLPSLIASVISFVTLSSFLGSAPLFDFAGSTGFASSDLYWSALLGLINRAGRGLKERILRNHGGPACTRRGRGRLGADADAHLVIVDEHRIPVAQRIGLPLRQPVLRRIDEHTVGARVHDHEVAVGKRDLGVMAGDVIVRQHPIVGRAGGRSRLAGLKRLARRAAHLGGFLTDDFER